MSVRQSNRIETFPLRFGRIGAPVVTNSSGAVPFGFGFSARGDLRGQRGRRLDGLLLPPQRQRERACDQCFAACRQGAACWVVVTADGRFAYTGNASGSISGYSIARDGALTALTAGGLSRRRSAPERPRGRRPLPVRVNPSVGEVTAYRIGDDGRLTPQPGVGDRYRCCGPLARAVRRGGHYA